MVPHSMNEQFDLNYSIVIDRLHISSYAFNRINQENRCRSLLWDDETILFRPKVVCWIVFACGSCERFVSVCI